MNSKKAISYQLLLWVADPRWRTFDGSFSAKQPCVTGNFIETCSHFSYADSIMSRAGSPTALSAALAPIRDNLTICFRCFADSRS